MPMRLATKDHFTGFNHLINPCAGGPGPRIQTRCCNMGRTSEIGCPWAWTSPYNSLNPFLARQMRKKLSCRRFVSVELKLSGLMIMVPLTAMIIIPTTTCEPTTAITGRAALMLILPAQLVDARNGAGTRLSKDGSAPATGIRSAAPFRLMLLWFHCHQRQKPGMI